jgi:hypothetical protein
MPSRAVARRGRLRQLSFERNLGDDDTDSLEAAYLAQPLEYQSTSQPVGQLLVLDLTDHSVEASHVSQCG